jgi:hypothetical protein
VSTTDDAPGLLDPDQAAAYLATTAEHLTNLRADGQRPSYVKVGRRVRYRVEDLEAYAANRLITIQPHRRRR